MWYTSAMPNLVVYVPADVARALEVKGVSEDIQRRACKEVLVGLANGELGAGGVVAPGSPSGVVPGSGAPAPSSRVRVNRNADPAGTVVARSDGKCPGFAPAGTKCKLCGKTH